MLRLLLSRHQCSENEVSDSWLTDWEVSFQPFPLMSLPLETLTSQLLRWAWRAQGLLFLAASSRKVSNEELISTDLWCRFHHLPLDYMKCKQTGKKMQSYEIKAWSSHSVKNRGCCNQGTLILSKKHSTLLFNGSSSRHRTQRENAKKLKIYILNHGCSDWGDFQSFFCP